MLMQSPSVVDLNAAPLTSDAALPSPLKVYPSNQYNWFARGDLHLEKLDCGRSFPTPGLHGWTNNCLEQFQGVGETTVLNTAHSLLNTVHY
jgi:hypothetical protein